VVKLDIDKMLWLDVTNKPEKLLTYLQELVDSKTDDDIPTYEDGKTFKKGWTEALIKKLGENISNTSTTEATQNS
jgi:hypothetical protein